MIIPPGPMRSIPDTQIEVSGFFAVVLAETVDEAKARFVEVCQRDGDFYRWIEVADVFELDLVPGAVLIRGSVG